MYHINNKYEVKECNASKKENCPFFGNFGNDNHYENFAQAKRISENVSSNNHNMFSGSASSAFVRSRNEISDYFNKLGLVREGHLLPEVRSTKEMVNKWFSGDKERYTSFKKVISDNELNAETKKEIAILLMRGFSVSTTENVRNLGAHDKDFLGISEVTIIGEKSDKVTQDDLKNGDAKAFLV